MEPSQPTSTVHTSTSLPGSSKKVQSETPDESTLQDEDDQVEFKSINGSKKRKRKSPYWKHMKRVDTKDANGKIINSTGICIYCKEEVKANTKSNGTSSLKYHLEKKCEKSPLIVKSIDPSQSILTNQTMGGGLVNHIFNQKRGELKCVEYIIRDEMPFRAIEGGGFVDLLHELQPRFKIPNRKKIASGVWDLFLLLKGKILSVIGIQRINITTDTWTSIQNINYMVVTAHFLDDDWKLHKRILNFTKITSHKGVDIGAMLEVCLKEWGVEKVFSITVDNAKSNNGAVKFMSKRLKSMNTLVSDGKYLHLKCACHILNLIVRDGLSELNSSIEGIRNCVMYIHSSPTRMSKFRDFAILEKLDSMATIPLDVATRWNSTFKMLNGADKYKGVFNRMNDENAPFVNYFNEMVKRGKKNIVKRVGPPSKDDWKKAQSFVHFLKKFYETTLKFSATKKCTSHLIFTEIVGLQIEIEKNICDSSNPVLQNVAKSMKLKFDKYWGSFEHMNKLVYIANVLDPRFKLQMIKISYKNLGADISEIELIVGLVRTCLIDLYNEYKGSHTTSSKCPDSMEYDICTDSVEDDDTQSQLLRALMQQRKDEKQVEISNEVDKYLSDPFENPMIKNFNILLWWKGNQERYPVLSKIARDILAIPSSTVASENAFSLGRRIVDPFRASLTPKMVEALVCSSDWLRADEFSFYKEPTEEELTLYKELEELEANLPKGMPTIAEEQLT